MLTLKDFIETQKEITTAAGFIRLTSSYLMVVREYIQDGDNFPSLTLQEVASLQN